MERTVNVGVAPRWMVFSATQPIIKGDRLLHQWVAYLSRFFSQHLVCCRTLPCMSPDDRTSTSTFAIILFFSMLMALSKLWKHSYPICFQIIFAKNFSDDVRYRGWNHDSVVQAHVEDLHCQRKAIRRFVWLRLFLISLHVILAKEPAMNGAFQHL